jgi:hypothetical protein
MNLFRISRTSLVVGVVALTLMIPSVAQATDFVAIVKQVTVNRSAAEVWKRVGGYCAIAEWLQVKCELTTGSGEIGSVRTLNGTTVEMLVGKSETSYTYWQTTGNMASYSYHGTLSVESTGPSTSRLTYVLLYDQGAMASDALRASEHERLSGRFQGALDTMKKLAESR